MKNNKCSVEGCDSICKCLGYCSRHYQQYKKYGCIKHVGRSEKDLNEIIEYDDYAEIVLYNKNCEEVARAIIDLDDIEKCKKYKWTLKSDSGYVCNLKNLNYIHRFIVNCPEDMVVDHVNHNKLDNRKINLRICSQGENTFNHKMYKTNTSGYPGVSWHKKANKWRVRIQIKGKEINLGLFEDLDEAIKVRKEAEIKYFGEYRYKGEDCDNEK